MRHAARWAALGVGLVVAALAVLLATQASTSPQTDSRASPLIGKRIPSFVVHTFDGQTLSPEGLAGKAVLRNFWNSWCPPCRQELPALKMFAQRHVADSAVVLVGIVRDDTTTATRAYAKAEQMTWPLAQDPDGNLALAFGTRGQPETYAISPDGVIAGSETGPTSLKNLEALLAAAQTAH